jgi:aminoglycoside phosphotransferase (APT) family kinase protein
MVHAPEAPTLVCHSDIGPWNTIVLDGKITGLIDWDLVAPGTPEWDLAYAAWRFAPLYPAGRTRFTLVEQANRIRLLLDGYGLASKRRQGFVRLVLQRMRSAVDTVERLGHERVPGFMRLYDGGLHLSGLDDLAWLRKHESSVTRRVESQHR